MIQRRTSLKRTPLKKQSKKRAKESRIYSAKRKAFLEAHPFCQWWLQENRFSEQEVITANNESGGNCVFTFEGPMSITRGWNVPRSIDVHHKAKRTGRNYLDDSTWMAVSRAGHEWIHSHGKEARAKGYLV